jgi:uncharacterized protein YndB with AHSA1/START domain
MNRPKPTDRANRILEITRVLDAPREVVFRHLLEPELIASWWGPDGFAVPAHRVEVEARPGGAHHKTMVLESAAIAAAMGMPVGSEFPDAATVLEVSPPSLLVLTSEPQPAMGLVERTITRIELHEEGPGRTRVVLTDGPYSEMMAPNAETGWTQQFGKLERLFAR